MINWSVLPLMQILKTSYLLLSWSALWKLFKINCMCFGHWLRYKSKIFTILGTPGLFLMDQTGIYHENRYHQILFIIFCPPSTILPSCFSCFFSWLYFKGKQNYIIFLLLYNIKVTQTIMSVKFNPVDTRQVRMR